MQFLASCNIEEAKGYSGKLVIPNEEGKVDKVSLNVILKTKEEVEDGLKSLKLGTIKCLTCMESPESIPDSLKGNVFREYTLDTFNKDKEEIEGVIPLVRLEDGYCDMRTLYNLSKERSDVRFIGGNLLEIEGIKIGRYDTGKEKMSSVFVEMYDVFLEIVLSQLENLKELVSKVRKRTSNVDVDGVVKEKKPKKKSQGKTSAIKAFNKLFGADTCVEF